MVIPLAEMGLFNWMPDEQYLRFVYHAQTGNKLDLKHPHSFNEKLQWLKLYDRKPIYTTMVDKYAVKEYVSSIIGDKYIIPTIEVWDNASKIDLSVLPKQFVLKCTHDNGSIIICKDKDQFNLDQAKKKLSHCLRKNIYWSGREWPYKNVCPRIIAEEYIENDKNGLVDYKVHVFNGVPRFILVCCDRYQQTGLTEDFFTTNWEHMDIMRPNIPNAAEEISKPEKLDEILHLSEKLARGVSFARVDFYIIHERVFFGEITFFPTSGFSSFSPEKWDNIFGSWIDLPDQKQHY